MSATVRVRSIWRLPLRLGSGQASLVIVLLVLLGLFAMPSGRAQLSSQQTDHLIFLPLVARNYPPNLVPLYRLTADPDDLAWLADNFLTDD